MKKLDKLFERSKRLKIDDSSKFVIMSDCHRGSGDTHDNFIRNQNIFNRALRHYYSKGFAYIELGDGDEMWEVSDYKKIVDEHLSSFKIMQKFNDDGRLMMIYGNHDIVKGNAKVVKDTFESHHNRASKKEEKLLKDLKVYESLVLTYKDREIFLLHGHQADFLNSTLWRLSRFLVRHLWRRLEIIGIKDPTSAARNYSVTKTVEKKLQMWSARNGKIVIAGHTHRPIFPQNGESLYFNDGSCVHPNGITCLEIENGKITLVRWFFHLNKNNVLTVKRRILAGSELIDDFFK
ncbi:MAG: metallophosphoesterase family protein [Malacoplasma sp.]|nr:metallophosphoesterase family protein [Malacoplasma sp.]